MIPQPVSAPVRVELRGWGWRHAGRRDWAVRGVDLVLEPGERVLLLGPSGAGKSTLLAALAGLHDPETAGTAEGLLLVDGRPAQDVRQRTGLVLQDPDSQLVMSRAGDDVAFGLENQAVPPEQIWGRVDAALAAVGFGYGRDRLTASLSGGEKQRLAIAGILARRPGLLLLDEPTANLDPTGADLVRGVLAAVLEQTGATCVLVEHRVTQVLSLVDRVVVLEPGAGVVADGAPATVFATHGEALAARGVWVPGRPPAARRQAPRAAGEQLVSGSGLGYRYVRGTTPLLALPDVRLRQGEALALTGPNGSGKSTLAMLLAGLRRPQAGTVRAGSSTLPLHRWPARRLAGMVGTVFQEPEHQFLARTVLDELELGPLRQGLRPELARQRAETLMARLHLERYAAANPFTLSGGEKRRLSVATALATTPEVLVLDEPTFGQDARTWAELLALCAELRDDGCALLTVTHDETFVAALADRQLVLR